MKHPSTELKEADLFISAISEYENNSLKVFDILMINQQYSQINILRKLAKDDVFDLSLKHDLESIIRERVGYLQTSVHYLYLKTANMNDLIARFQAYSRSVLEKPSI